LRSPHFGRYGRYGRVPRLEQRNGVTVEHPRYPVVPKIGMHIAPALMAFALLPHFRSLKRTIGQRFVLDAHFLYPDGVALALIARRLRLPLVLTARGSDVNWFCRYPLPRAMVRWATHRSVCVVAVSRALRDRLLTLGAAPEKVVVLPNGVDAERFAPRDRNDARVATRYHGFTLLSVGNLLPLKGHDLAIEAIARIPDARLSIIGEGPEEARLRRLIAQRGVGARVTISHNLPQDALIDHYSAADALVLASEREGMPNVVLESLACGTPVIGTAVGGIPELLTSAHAGVLARERSVEGLGHAIETLRRNYPDRMQTRMLGLARGWKPTIDGLLDVYRIALESEPAMGASSTAP
jgi:glycosyltransferase involved in cell wall biosynthesis